MFTSSTFKTIKLTTRVGVVFLEQSYVFCKQIIFFNLHFILKYAIFIQKVDFCVMKSFWKLCLQEKFVTLWKFSLEIIYHYLKARIFVQSTSSTVNLIKSKSRNCIEQLIIRIVHRVNTTTGCWIDIVNLAFEKQNVNHHVNYENSVDIKWI